MPVPNWVFLAGKLAAQLAVVLCFTAAGIVTAMVCQLAMGYTHLEPVVYLKGFVVMVAAVRAHLLPLQLPAGRFRQQVRRLPAHDPRPGLERRPGSLDFDHNLYSFAGPPDAPYSDMNGYGHFVAPLFWFSTLLGVLRRRPGGPRRAALGARHRHLVEGAVEPRQAAASPARVRVVLIVAALGFVATGGFIFYNTNVLNEYVPDDVGRDRQAEYEKKYRQYRDVPQPRIARRLRRRRHLPRRAPGRDPRPLPVGEHDGTQPIAEIHVTITRRVTVNALDFPAHTDEARRPARRLPDLHARHAAAARGGDDHRLRPHGRQPRLRERRLRHTDRRQRHLLQQPRSTSRRSATTTSGELQDRNERRKHGLPPVHRMPRLDDLVARRQHLPRQRRRLDRLRDHRLHQRRPDRDRPGLPAARVDRGRPPLLPLQDGRADPALLLVPLGALRGEARRVERRRHRDLLPRAAPLQRRPDDRGGQEVARLLHGQLRPLPAPPGAHRRVPALRARSRSRFPNTIPYSESHRLHRRLERGDGRHRLRRSTSPPTRSRTSGGRTR